MSYEIRALMQRKYQKTDVMPSARAQMSWAASAARVMGDGLAGLSGVPPAARNKSQSFTLQVRSATVAAPLGGLEFPPRPGRRSRHELFETKASRVLKTATRLLPGVLPSARSLLFDLQKGMR